MMLRARRTARRLRAAGRARIAGAAVMAAALVVGLFALVVWTPAPAVADVVAIGPRPGIVRGTAPSVPWDDSPQDRRYLLSLAPTSDPEDPNAGLGKVVLRKAMGSQDDYLLTYGQRAVLSPDGAWVVLERPVTDQDSGEAMLELVLLSAWFGSPEYLIATYPAGYSTGYGWSPYSSGFLWVDAGNGDLHSVLIEGDAITDRVLVESLVPGAAIDTGADADGDGENEMLVTHAGYPAIIPDADGAWIGTARGLKLLAGDHLDDWSPTAKTDVRWPQITPDGRLMTWVQPAGPAAFGAVDGELVGSLWAWRTNIGDVGPQPLRTAEPYGGAGRYIGASVSPTLTSMYAQGVRAGEGGFVGALFRDEGAYLIEQYLNPTDLTYSFEQAPQTYPAGSASEGITFLGGMTGGYVPFPSARPDYAEVAPGVPTDLDPKANDYGYIAQDGLALTGDSGDYASVHDVLDDDGYPVDTVLRIWSAPPDGQLTYRVCPSYSVDLGGCSESTIEVVSTVPPAPADLAVDVEGPLTAAAGAETAIVVTVANLTADAAALGVTVNYGIDRGAQFVRIEGINGSSVDGCEVQAAGDNGNRLLACPVGIIGAGGTWSATVIVRNRLAPGPQQVLASATSANDPATNNNGDGYELMITGAKAVPTIALATEPASPVYANEYVELQAAVAAPDGIDVPLTGRVQFYGNGQLIDPYFYPVEADGLARFRWTPRTAGPVTISATYAGDPAYQDVSTPGQLLAVVLRGHDATITSMHSDPFLSGGAGAYTLRIANNGNLAAPITGFRMQLPNGITYTSATAAAGADGSTPWAGWECSPESGGAAIACTLNEAVPLAPGASMPPVTVAVAIADGSTGGVATATVLHLDDPATTADDDINPANNTVEDPTAVTASGGVDGLQIAVGGDQSGLAGQTVALQFTASNVGEDAADGPITVTAALPNGKPAGQKLAYEGFAGDGWTCAGYPLGEQTIVRCRHADGLAPGAKLPPVQVMVASPPGDGFVSNAISYDVRAADGLTTSHPPVYRLIVGPKASAHLTMTMSGPATAQPTGSVYTIDLANNGVARTTGPLTVRLPLPAGYTATPAPGSPWACTPSSSASGAIACTTQQVLGIGMPAPALALTIAAAPNLDPTSLIATATTTDALGDATATAAMNVQSVEAGAPNPEVTRVVAADGSYRVTVANVGERPTAPGAQLRLTEALPAGFIATAAGSGWTCTQSRATLTCDNPAGLAPGQSAPELAVVLAPPAGFAGGTLAISGFARSAAVIGASSSTPLVFPAPPSDAATLTTTTATDANPVVRGESAVATVALHGDASVDAAGPVVFGLILPDGATIDGELPAASGPLADAAPGEANAADQPVGPVSGDNSPTCRLVPGAAAVVCVQEALPAGQRVEQDVPFSIAGNADGLQRFVSGRIVVSASSTGSVDAMLANAAARILDFGVSALGAQAVTEVPVTGFVASAGAPQAVLSHTPGEDGTPKPTVVVLDATGTSPAPGHVLTFGWVQTTGPAVAWAPAAEGAMPTADTAAAGGRPVYPLGSQFPDGTTAPQTYGDKPTFTVPALSEATELGFRVYVTDGISTYTADTVVTATPLANSAPQADSFLAYNLTDHPDCGGECSTPIAEGDTPQAGDRIRLVVKGSDADGDTISITTAVAKPAELGITLSPVAGNADGNPVHAVEFFWPADVVQVTITATLLDGKKDTEGNAVSSKAALSIGPDAPAVVVAIDPITDPQLPTAKVALKATLTNGEHEGATTKVTWRQVEAAEGLAVTLEKTDALETAFTVPLTGKAGDTITLAIDAVRGEGSTAVTATSTIAIALADPKPLAVSVAGLGDLQVEPELGLTIKATATGTGDKTYAWKLLAGEGSLTDADQADVTYTAGESTGFSTLLLTVTDTLGRVRTTTVPVLVGDAPSISDGTGEESFPPCDTRSTFGHLWELAQAAGASTTMVSIGDVRIDLGQLSLPGDECDADVEIAIEKSTATYGPLTFTDLTGKVNKSRLSISHAVVTASPEYRLGTTTIDDLLITFSPFSITGTIHWTGELPFLYKPDTETTVDATLSLQTDRLLLTATAGIAGGTASLTAVIPTDLSGFNVGLTLDKVTIFKSEVTGAGSLTVVGGKVTGGVTLAFGPTSAIPNVALNGGELTWTPEALRIKASGVIDNHVAVAVDGDYTDGDNYAFKVTGAPTGEWSPVAGLILGTDTAIAGSVSAKAGVVTYDLAVTYAGSWKVGPLTLTKAAIRLANTAELGPSCPVPPGTPAPDPGTDGGTTDGQDPDAEPVQRPLFLTLDGEASVKIGAKNLKLATAACAIPSTGAFRVVTKATVPNLTLAPQVSFNGATLTVAGGNGAPVSAVLVGSVLIKGAAGKGTLALLNDGTDFLAAATIDMKKLGIKLPGNGKVIYTTTEIADASTIPGLDLGQTEIPDGGSTGSTFAAAAASPGSLVNLGIKKGLTALKDFTLPAPAAKFLEEKLNLPAQPKLIIKVNLDEKFPVISAALEVGEQGITVFTTNSGTRLGLNQIALRIDLGGGFGLDAAAKLQLPKPDGDGTQVTTLDLKASLSIQLAGAAPGITLSLTKTGDSWDNAFDIAGLTLGDVAVQGGVTFTVPPTPTLGFAAKVISVPADWRTSLGIQTDAEGAMEPISFGVNISATSPVFAFEVGVPDGKIAIKPLASVSARAADALQVDYAKLVVAPLGGKIGEIEYPKGIALQFDALVLDTAVNIKAAVGFGPFSLNAEATVAAFTAGPLSMSETKVKLVVSPTDGLDFSFVGGMALTGGESLAVTVAVKAPKGGDVTFDVRGTVQNIGISSLLQLDYLSIQAKGAIPSLKATPSFTLAVGAQASVLGTQVVFVGDLSLAAGRIAGFSFTGGASTISPAPGVEIGGPGCPAATKIPEGMPPLPASGPCVQVAFAAGSPDPLTIQVDGSVKAAGLSAAFHGKLDGAGLDVRATLAITDSVTVAASGRIYFGSKLEGVKDKDAAGNPVQVKAGDFRIATTIAANVSLLSLQVNLDANAGNIGGTQWVKASAGVSLLGSSVTLKGDFARLANGSVSWSVEGKAAFNVGGITLADATVKASSAGSFSIDASVNAGPVTGKLIGSFAKTGGVVKYAFAGSASITILGSTIGAQLELNNTSGYTHFAGSIHANLGDSVRIDAAFTLDGQGRFCVSGAAQVIGITGSASYCSPGTAKPGLFAEFSTHGFTLKGAITPTYWSLRLDIPSYDWADGIGGRTFGAGAEMHFTLHLAVSSNQGLDFHGEGRFAIWVCAFGGCGDLAFGITVNVGEIISVCASGTILGTTVEACYRSDRGFELVKP